ncbi:MAG: hypothetical protein AB7U20_08785 [Planctomycetaceae bacterium]
MKQLPARTPQRYDGRAWKTLLGLAVVQGILYAAIARLSRRFVYGEGFQDRPILTILGLFAVCFACYAASQYAALRTREGIRLGFFIVLAAIAFRVLLLFSQPIQEIDIYRYLWDGAVAARGVSPFRYAPAEVIAAAQSKSEAGEELPGDLAALVRQRDASPPVAEILERIHYPELTTVYPPVSQAVFWMAARFTPPSASVSARIMVMKAVLLCFDIAAIGLIWLLLGETGKHRGWVLSYAWCPLVIKEFANSGHVDSIAVCFTIASLYSAVNTSRTERRSSRCWSLVSAVLLGLAVGAKLYAVVLLPLLTLFVARRSRTRQGSAFLVTALASMGVCLAPMLSPVATNAPARFHDAPGDKSPSLPNDASAPPAPSQLGDRSGLSAFLGRWEMNDFLFLIVVENLRPAAAQPDQPPPWFAVVPDSWRDAIVTPMATAESIDLNRATFALARFLTGAVFLCVAALLLYRVIDENSDEAFLEAAFLTLAWFWLLSPTQNPWYWTWALPLLPFARGRAWFAVSGLVFAYYLRFWLLYHWPNQTVPGSPYDPPQFFDFVVTWVEFAPWFAWLAGAALARRLRHSPSAKLTADAGVPDFTENRPAEWYTSISEANLSTESTRFRSNDTN